MTKKLKSIKPALLLKFLLLPGLCFLCFSSSAQKRNAGYQYHIRRAESPITIDGVIDDAWLKADSANNFFMVTPMDTSLAKVHTEVRMSFDNNNLYLIAVC